MGKANLMERDSLAFQITNDLLFAKVICEDASPTKVQSLVQARLDSDLRLRREIIHFRDNKGVGSVCHQVGKVQITSDASKVTCLRCLEVYRVHGTYERW